MATPSATLSYGDLVQMLNFMPYLFSPQTAVSKMNQTGKPLVTANLSKPLGVEASVGAPNGGLPPAPAYANAQVPSAQGSVGVPNGGLPPAPAYASAQLMPSRFGAPQEAAAHHASIRTPAQAAAPLAPEFISGAIKKPSMINDYYEALKNGTLRMG